MKNAKKSNSKKRIISGENKPAFPNAISKNINKNLKKSSLRQSLIKKLQNIHQDKLVKPTTHQAPLKHLEGLSTSIFNIQEELERKQNKLKNNGPSKADLNRDKVVSARGRAKILSQERESFKAVLQHSEFRKNPMRTIHTHITNSMEAKRATSQVNQ